VASKCSSKSYLIHRYAIANAKARANIIKLSSKPQIYKMIPAEEFAEIISELKRQPLPINAYRNKAGSGRSQAFGVVGRRSLAPDYSRLCWLRPYLYKLLLDFAAKWVTIPFTSITVNQSYAAAPHKDKGNVGDSFLVAFGDYQGGELEVLEGDLKGMHNVRYTPLITDFSKVLHSVKEFTGDRYSLVFYTAKKSEDLPKPSVEVLEGKYVFKRGDEVVKGLPHPLKGRKKDLKISFKKEDVVIEFV